jgi:glycosyltransferase involved in cell wall biosynthesis
MLIIILLDSSLPEPCGLVRASAHISGVRRLVATQATAKISVVQDGARGHYRLPVGLARAGMLGQVFADFYCPPGTVHAAVARLIGMASRSTAQRMLDRHHDEIDPRKVRFSYANLIRQLRGRRRIDDVQDYYEWQAKIQGEWILRQRMETVDAIMGFVRNLDPDFCLRVRDRGMLVVADQIIAPALLEMKEDVLQTERYSGWEKQDRKYRLPAVDAFERRTWPVLDHIICASNYVRVGLIEVGIPAEKVTTINYPIDPHAYEFVDRRGRNGPMIVGFVGSVGLRKGAPFVFEMSRRFSREEARFVMIGPLGLRPEIVEKHRGNVEVMGALPRSKVAERVRQFDVIYFPTTCEGSAISLMEAMATGLPIVTSPNSGTVARHGQEAFICPYDDLDAAEGYLRVLMEDRALRWRMGAAARRRCEEYDLSNYSRRLSELFGRLKKLE